MRNIALCMQLSDFYEHGIARGVVRYAKSRGDWRLYGYGWMFRSIEDLGAWKGDGVIARVESSEAADSLAALGLPLVDVAGAYPRPGFREVTNDDYLTGFRAGRHLRSCGFTRFAFLGVAGTLWSRERCRGFLRAIGEDRGDPRHAVLPSFERGLSWWESGTSGITGLDAFLRTLDLPAALFACNDTTGLRATERARRLGIGIPDELAILGVDDEDILCELASPSLSSVKLDCETIGYRAAQALDAMLDTPGTAELTRISVPPREIAERESTLVFTCEDELVARAATFIRAKAHEGIRVPDILAVVPASRRALETRFRRAMGRSLHEEILRARLGRARRLLLETDLTVERVALSCGFTSLQRFHSAFRTAEGTSPGAYRAGRRGGNPDGAR